jgi:tetratricopeptide (TPR) repeat protein
MMKHVVSKSNIYKKLDRLKAQIQTVRLTDPSKCVIFSDKLISESLQSGDDRHLAYGYASRADGLRMQGLNDEAEFEFDRAIVVARETKDGSTEVIALNGRGIVDKYRGRHDLAKVWYERSEIRARELGDRNGEGLALANLSSIYSMLRMNQVAVEYARKSYELLQGSSSEYLALFRLATLIADSGDYQSAIDLFERALALGRHYKITNAISRAYSEIGRMKVEFNEFADAKKYYQKALRLSTQAKDSWGIAHNTREIGNCHIDLGHYEEGQTLVIHAMGLFKTMGEIRETGLCCRCLAELEIKRANFGKALQYLDRGAVILQEVKADGEERSHFHKSYSETYEGLGDWKKVAYHERELGKIADEEYSSNFRTSIKEVQVFLGTERERHQTEMEKIRSGQLERELSLKASAFAAQTELLSQFREELRKIRRDIRDPINALKAIDEKLKDLPCESVDWVKFEKEFAAVHPEFRKKLKEIYPDLSNQELRLCQLLRSGLKSHEAARLMCITERGVETHRLRIRKKLGLKGKESLTEILQTL